MVSRRSALSAAPWTRSLHPLRLPAMKALLRVLWLALACGSAHTTLSKSDAKKAASKTLQEKVRRRGHWPQG